MTIVTTEIEQVWSIITEGLKERLSMPGYETFLATAAPISYSDGVLALAVPNPFSKEWLKERCESHILQILHEKLQQSVLIDLHIQKSTALVSDDEVYISPQVSAPSVSGNPVSPPVAAGHHFGQQNYPPTHLNPKYTFETYVEGNNNRMAHAAAVAVSQAPARAYNPLFIYGGVGLGKTHLMQAIGQKTLQLNPKLKVTYVSTEQFTNDLINAIKDKQNHLFRSIYRSTDILLIDDIQFIAGKERTQEEFFHTFNTLYENNKQIVISSDRPSHDIPTLEDRLRSRFEWGLTVDIQPPDLETRMAILKKKADQENVDLGNDVLEYLAGQIPSNIRELEGALTRLLACSSLFKRPIDMEFTMDTIKTMFKPSQRKPVTIPAIMRAVSEECGVTTEDLCKKNRTKELAHARQVAMYLARELTKSSLPKIGDSFGGRDHTTVMYACDRIKEELQSDQNLKHIIDHIIHRLEHSTAE